MLYVAEQRPRSPLVTNCCRCVARVCDRLSLFFFSSRRRHTRLQGDWSSDVCSSDLGGLALAVGILVDDATVEIENTNRNLDQGKEIRQAILDGASQIAVPALVSTLCICIVFLPMFFLSGVARYLFVPLAEAVVFAMLASYFLSRTLVPTMALYLLKPKDHHAATSRNPFIRFQDSFERGFERLRLGYQRVLTTLVHRRGFFLSLLLLLFVFALGLLSRLLAE